VSATPHSGFRHEALFYEGHDAFLAGTVPFVSDAVARGGAVLVALGDDKTALLREALGADARPVHFAPMEELGRNPARILPAWRDFVAEHAGFDAPVRGIGEPVWPGRTAAEIDECHRHEALLNLAFAGASDWWLMCPYDTGGLDPAVVRDAARTHPHLVEAGTSTDSADYTEPAPTLAPGDPLPEPAGDVLELAFTLDDLSRIRALVGARAREAGLDGPRATDLVLAVNELATNSVRHAGGGGLLRVWEEDGATVCEVRDDGRIRDPLAGRVRPVDDRPGGRGLWMVNHLCDFVQLRRVPAGSLVRVRMNVG
jgi:anti-sigma regulatory factor (Ser/Thr protein kinase)